MLLSHHILVGTAQKGISRSFDLEVSSLRILQLFLEQGIVAAIRQLGGRFLELDERTGIYTDIGDKKAVEKTSQALREGQTKIRKQMYKEEEEMAAGNNPTPHDTSVL